MTSLTSKKAATEILRRRALASLNRDCDAIVSPASATPVAAKIVVAAAALVTSTPTPESASNPPDRPTQNADGSWTFGGVHYEHGHDAWASFPPRGKPELVPSDWRGMADGHNPRRVSLDRGDQRGVTAPGGEAIEAVADMARRPTPRRPAVGDARP